MKNFKIIGAALFFVIVLLVGIAVGSTLSQRESDTSGDEFQLLAEIRSILEREHFNRDAVDSETLTREAINGMLTSLDDPYAAYLTPDRHAVASQDLRGNFSGIGAQVEIRNGEIIIVSPMANTPAERAGLRPGDIILSIDGESTEGFALLQAVNKIRGPRGEAVLLDILHRGDSDSVELSIIRDIIDITSVNLKMLVGRIAHIRISDFWETTDQELTEALKKVEGFQARGLILDVRNNPGGLVQSVVDVTSHFIDGGIVLYEIRGDGSRRDWNANSDGLAKDIPLVLLVNGGSASGSEVLAGALMDYERATVIGAKTFGKGSVNVLRDLSDGSGLTFTVARWYTPEGTLIEGEGLQPDIPVQQPDDGVDDVQLDKAIEILEGKVAALGTGDGQL